MTPTPGGPGSPGGPEGPGTPDDSEGVSGTEGGEYNNPAVRTTEDGTDSSSTSGDVYNNGRYVNGPAQGATPKTGDESKTGLWIMLAMSLALGAAWAFKKSNDGKDNQRS